LVDQNLILRKLSQLEEYLSQIREYSHVAVQEYALNWRTQRIVERTLQMMIELCLDVSGHIVSDMRLRTPTSYADVFKVLHENDLINADQYQVMEKMAKFRNVVVHHYDRVDETIVVTILSKHLDDFLVFRDVVIGVLKGQAKDI
jgi:uncharacterized protein YutE (UPF0331/DUF86 family)